MTLAILARVQADHVYTLPELWAAGSQEYTDKTGEVIPYRLGETVVNFQDFILGRRSHFKEYLPIEGGGEICISIEYDTTGPDPVKGDVARILQIGHPMDVYPLDPHKVYRVDHLQQASEGHCDVVTAYTYQFMKYLLQAVQCQCGAHHCVQWSSELALVQLCASYAAAALLEGACYDDGDASLLYAAMPWSHRLVLTTLAHKARHLIAAPVGVAAAEALQRVQEHGLSGAVDTAGQLFRGGVWALQRWARGGLSTVKTDTRCALGLITVAEAQAEENAAFNAAAVAYAKKHDITAPNSAAATAAAGAAPSATTGTADNGHHSPGKIRSSASSSNSADVLSTGQSIALLRAANASESDSSDSGTDEPVSRGGADSTSSSTSSRSGSSGAVLSTVDGASPLQQQQQLPRTRDCPITGCPIEDPAVAADGHTYERYATTPN
eukprot:17963-Heterococcus_DN1.PRE.4